MIWMIAGIVALGGVLVGPIMSDVEQAKYTVVRSDDAVELRDYAPSIVAETTVTGQREEAIQTGFRTLADYIFGNNSSGTKLAMTAPVTQQSGEKIAMTAPVMQQAAGASWTVHFVMPASYPMDTLPKPKNQAVTLKEIPERRFAVQRFSGTSSHENLEQHRQALQAWIAAQELHAVAPPVYAFYNPPWTLPFLRRNEVLIQVEKE